jgi:hypothetical protein
MAVVLLVLLVLLVLRWMWRLPPPLLPGRLPVRAQAVVVVEVVGRLPVRAQAVKGHPNTTSCLPSNRTSLHRHPNTLQLQKQHTRFGVFAINSTVTTRL